MKEVEILDILTKRYVIPEPNCKQLVIEGKSLGMEKFASLFVCYIFCCISSLFILIVENVFKPSKSHTSKSTDPNKLLNDISALKYRFIAFEEELEILEAKNALILLKEIRLLSR